MMTFNDFHHFCNFWKWNIQMETQTRLKIEYLRLNSDDEYICEKFR